MRRAILVCAVVLGLPFSAAGQVQDRPARPEEGLFGGGRAPDAARLRHELALTTNVLAGYDEIVQSGVDPSGIVQPRTTGSTGLFETNLQYGLIQATRSVQVSGRGYLTAYQGGDALVGADAQVSASTAMGRRTRISVSQAVRNAPYLALGEFGQLSSAVGSQNLPGNDPTLGLADQRSWQLSTTGSFDWDWTTRQTLSVGADYAQTTFDNEGAGFDSRSQGANLDYNWRFSRVAGMRLGYTLSRADFVDQAGQDMVDHTFDGGFTYSRRVSRTRQISFAADAGVAYVETLSPTTDTLRGHWTPTASGSVGVDIGRSWSANVDYNRMPAVLDQVTTETFYSNAIALSTGGLIARRLDATFMMGLVKGRQATSQDGSGRYESYTASAQLRWALARCCATLLSYSYYDYSLHDVVVVAGLPSASRNQGLRIGFSVWTPLHRQRGAATTPR